MHLSLRSVAARPVSTHLTSASLTSIMPEMLSKHCLNSAGEGGMERRQGRAGEERRGGALMISGPPLPPN